MNESARLAVVETILVFAIWIYFLLFIVADALGLALTITNFYQFIKWLPYVGMGLLFTIDLVDSIKLGKSIFRIFFVAIALIILSMFVQG